MATTRDRRGRKIPEKYLAGLPPRLRQRRIDELTESREAYRHGDYSELPSDREARKMGLVKQSAYTTVAKQRGIEWRGDALDMAKRVYRYYGGSGSPKAFAKGLEQVFAKGLAAWRSGGHRPGATAQNWAVARVNSLVVGGKAAWTADKKQFGLLPPVVRKHIVQSLPEVYEALKEQNRQSDITFIRSAAKKAKANPADPTGAGLVIIDKKGRVLILRRGPTAPWMPGKWNLPSGVVEKKESLFNTACREAEEETGLDIYRARPLGVIDSGEGWAVSYFAAIPGDWEGHVDLDHENDAYVWIRPEELHHFDVIPTVKEAIQAAQ